MFIDYLLKKSHKRKTISINIRNSQVTVLAPHFVSKSYIDSLVLKKQKWIKTKIAEQNLNLINTENRKSAIEDKQFLLFGRTVAIQLAIESVSDIKFNNDVLLLSANKRVKNITAHYEKQLKAFLKQSLESYLETKLFEISKMMKLNFSDYQVKIYKRRWGACNSKKELSFNTLLAGAPKWVIDYVIVHEVAHLKYLNHSQQFWRLVNQHNTDVKAAELWLKQNGINLEI